jgi:hypothetical protein
MNQKSKFRENLDGLSDDQFAAVEADMAAAKAARGGDADYGRRLAGMTPFELEKEWAKHGR